MAKNWNADALPSNGRNLQVLAGQDGKEGGKYTYRMVS
jgi:hypothetical protein